MAAPQTQGHGGHSSEAGGAFALQVLRWVLTCQQVSWRSTLYWWPENLASGTSSPKGRLNHNTLLCDQDPGQAPAPLGPPGAVRGRAGRTPAFEG